MTSIRGVVDQLFGGSQAGAQHFGDHAAEFGGDLSDQYTLSLHCLLPLHRSTELLL